MWPHVGRVGVHTVDTVLSAGFGRGTSSIHGGESSGSGFGAFNHVGDRVDSLRLDERWHRQTGDGGLFWLGPRDRSMAKGHSKETECLEGCQFQTVNENCRVVQSADKVSAWGGSLIQKKGGREKCLAK